MKTISLTVGGGSYPRDTFLQVVRCIQVWSVRREMTGAGELNLGSAKELRVRGIGNIWF